MLAKDVEIALKKGQVIPAHPLALTAEEIDRVYAAYPHLNDDDFVAEHLDDWLG